ncbi:DMT family transporter [Urechidicola croceus]|uniref:Permease n=1 Tax=Urechidicola croceus TaxID=1850246 RepID=A0A1D8P8H6_9FLAO|nr:EamA family transporter [Urechidicola croceus]AOW20866.1 permease [Urechidicola croceus]
MNSNQLKWFYLIILSIIWGSSFILIKKGLIGLTPLQLGALRIIITGFILLLFGLKNLKTIEKSKWKWIIISGLLGTFFPAFLFSFAETEVDSAVASILNSLVPLNTILFGFAIFKITTTTRQTFGVIIGFIGTAILIASGKSLNPDQNYFFAGFIILATVMYAINVNIIKKYLQQEKPLTIAVGNFAVIIIPAFIILLFSNFFSKATFENEHLYKSIVYVAVLSTFGTALAKVMFNKLVQISTPVFASSVTYVMTIVAVSWGLLDGEKLGLIQIIGGIVILLGVYLSNRK